MTFIIHIHNRCGQQVAQLSLTNRAMQLASHWATWPRPPPVESGVSSVSWHLERIQNLQCVA